MKMTYRALCRPVFQDGNLPQKTKRKVYHAVILGVILYGAEAWVNKRVATRKLESFHSKCLKWILGITKTQQGTSYITSAKVRRRFGMEETLEDVIAARRLR